MKAAGDQSLCFTNKPQRKLRRDMKLHTLLACLHSLVTYKGENPEITSIENDHRKCTEGSLFICINGYTVDGHDFAQAAVASGASAILAEHHLHLPVPVIVVRDTQRAMAVLADAFYDHPTQKLRLIGITGTNGKTTISHLLEKIFEDQQQTTGLIGTMYTKVGKQTYETKNTTPDSVTLQQTFSNMNEANVETAIMEVSSHALVLGRVHGCDYDIAVFTNLTQDHLDFHQTMERYKQAKSLLFAQLGNTYDDSRPKYAVLNADDAATAEYIEATAATIVTYGIDKSADVMAKDMYISAAGTTFTLVLAGQEYQVQMKLIGKFSVYNVLAAIAAALCAGVNVEASIQSIEDMMGVAGRFELVSVGQDFPVIVDYAHTPDGLENVLQTVREFATKRIFVVVGCGGDRDKTKRPLMASIACQLATDPIFTSDNPRSEDAAQILREMEAGVVGQAYQVIEDRRQAIQYAVTQASANDVIVIAGKGHETYQLVGNQVLHFDDREEAKQAISNKI